MPGRSIYIEDNPAFSGGSEQATYEVKWAEDGKKRLRVMAGAAAGGLVLGTIAANLGIGLLLGIAAFAGTWLYFWRRHAASSVWRRGRHGHGRSARILNWTLGRAGHTVLAHRVVPGHEGIFTLVIGPGGTWVVDSAAWHPESDVAAYSGKLFIGQKPGAARAAALHETAQTVARLLTDAVGFGVRTAPLLVVHGGRLPAYRVLVADGITVLRPARLPLWIRAHRFADLTPERIGAVARAANHLMPPRD
ncbi:MAG: NERD domain-containing protein [Streptosporangiales bacterium]|nr:NERD domain-containing protein [Streptosporangiales bacterium]